MGKTVRVALTKKEPIDYENMIIEFEWGGKPAVGLVTKAGRCGFAVTILASNHPANMPSECAVAYYKDGYKNIEREDLPLYLNFRHKTELFERILLED